MPAHKLYPKWRQRLGLTRRGRRRQRAEFQRLNRRQGRAIRAAKAVSRLLHLSFYAMEPGRTIGHLVAILADLKLAFAVGGAHDKFGVAFFGRRPTIAPERP